MSGLTVAQVSDPEGMASTLAPEVNLDEQH
jgi:hypothetical protein